MSFASGRFVAAAAGCRQPRPMAMEIMVSAVMTRGARARVAIEDRSLVILAVPLGHPGIPQELLSQDFRFWASLPASRITLLEVIIVYRLRAGKADCQSACRFDNLPHRVFIN